MGERKDTDVILERALIVSRESPIVYFGPAVTGSFSGNHLYHVGAYVPRFFRRSRLRRFAPLAARFAVTRTCWRWAK